LWPVRLRARRALGLPKNAFIVLQGKDDLGPDCGRDMVLQGVAQLAERHDVRALLIDVPAATAPAALRHWYSAADVVVCTPSQSAHGRAVVAAMACAAPVIATRVGAIRSIVLDGRTGYLIPPHDALALADRLASLHADPALARSLGLQGWQRAHRCYTWRSAARRITAVYERAWSEVAAMAARPPAAHLYVNPAAYSAGYPAAYPAACAPASLPAHPPVNSAAHQYAH
jgi:D-inositol-3-phosphate glycosyltransferase